MPCYFFKGEGKKSHSLRSFDLPLPLNPHPVKGLRLLAKLICFTYTYDASFW